MFIDWKVSLFTIVDPFLSEISVDEDSIPADGTSQALITISPKNNSDTLLASGLEIILTNSGDGTLSPIFDLGNGIYEATITAPTVIGSDTISAKVISSGDTVSIFTKITVQYISPVSVIEDEIAADRFYLYQNYPQPFNPSTKIKYQLPEVSTVTLKIYDVLGKEVATLVNETKSAGTYEVVFDATGLTSGIYFYTLNAGSFSETKKMILTK